MKTALLLQVGVTGAQHGRKARGFFLAPAPFARLFVMAVVAHFLQSAFAIHLLLQPAQGLVYAFAFS